MNRLFSIITVCYNEEKTIKKTLESVLEQDYTDYEYVIKDGGSQDKTNDIIEEYRSQFVDKGVLFKHISEEDKGTYDAMNIAAAECYGDYLIFLNGGDSLYKKGVLSEAAKIIKSDINGTLKENYIYKNKEDDTAHELTSEIDVYYGNGIMEDDIGKSLFKADMSLIDQRMAFIHQAGIVRRETFLKHPYDLRFPICADYNFFLTIYDEGAIFKPLDTIICVYNANGISSTAFVKKRKEHEKILSEHGRNKWYRKAKNMTEAYIKQGLNRLPKAMTRKMKLWYKYHVKHYEKWSESQ